MVIKYDKDKKKKGFSKRRSKRAKLLSKLEKQRPEKGKKVVKKIDSDLKRKKMGMDFAKWMTGPSLLTKLKSVLDKKALKSLEKKMGKDSKLKTSKSKVKLRRPKEIDTKGITKKAVAKKLSSKVSKTKTSKSKVSEKAVKTVKTKGGDYKVYKKESKKAGSFRSAFKSNCAGKGAGDSFSWNGKSYSCARASDKKKSKPKSKIGSYDYGEGTKKRKA